MLWVAKAFINFVNIITCTMYGGKPTAIFHNLYLGAVLIHVCTALCEILQLNFVPRVAAETVGCCLLCRMPRVPHKVFLVTVIGCGL